MEDKYLMVSLEDEKANLVSEIIGNKTCRKILDHLSEKESTETDISKELKIPLNTVDYNIKKLLKAGFIESKSFFWSVKGKKIPVYKVSNKSIIISPKRNKLKSFLPIILLAGVGAVAIKYYSMISNPIRQTASSLDYASGSAENLMAATPKVADTIAHTISSPSFFSSIPIWAWFLSGALFALILYLILNYKKL
jgi:DNA-binding transcriptional ArsR family regulator